MHITTLSILPEGCTLTKDFGRVVGESEVVKDPMYGSYCNEVPATTSLIKTAQDQFKQEKDGPNAIMDVRTILSETRKRGDGGDYRYEHMEGTAVRIEGPGFTDPF